MKLKKLVEVCTWCGGSGIINGIDIPCFKCNGKGFVFKDGAVAKIREELKK